MHRLTLADVARLRSTPGLMLGLFLTDRCPVGCGHCSVDSRGDSPTISDFALFEAIVAAICAQTRVTTVTITGGEPFVERRGLALAVERIAAAGKDLVIFTSGVWASGAVPAWIGGVLRQASCVFLSTDAFHAASIDDARFVRAARAIADAGVWIIVQVIKQPPMVQKAEQLLHDAFGDHYADYAELNLTEPLPIGRGAAIFTRRAGRSASTFGACSILGAPVIRYDGATSACCNEQVIMGLGPERLQRRCTSADEVTATLAQFDSDPLLHVISRVGTGMLTQHPRFADLEQQEFSSICELCWAIQKRGLPLGDHSDRLLTAMAALSQ